MSWSDMAMLIAAGGSLAAVILAIVALRVSWDTLRESRITWQDERADRLYASRERALAQLEEVAVLTHEIHENLRTGRGYKAELLRKRLFVALVSSRIHVELPACKRLARASRVLADEDPLGWGADLLGDDLLELAEEAVLEVELAFDFYADQT